MQNFWQALQKPFFVLAPLDGVTDYVFREIIAGTAKPNVLFTEFTSTDALFSKGFDKTIGRFKYSENQRYIVAQIWGTDPEKFYKAGQLLKDLKFDGIDINMGCPDRNVMKCGSGSAHMNNPGLVSELIRALKEGSGGLPVSIKTRLGIKSLLTGTWIKFLLEQDLAALTIHGRTATELSKTPVHWDEIQKAVQIRNEIAPQTLLIANGGIMNLEEGRGKASKYGVDGIMMGKAIFSDPWVFEKIPQKHTNKEHLELLLKHTKMFTEEYPEKHKFNVIKKFFKIYVKSFRGSNKLKIALMETKNYQEVEGIIKSYL